MCRAARRQLTSQVSVRAALVAATVEKPGYYKAVQDSLLAQTLISETAQGYRVA